MFTKTQIKSFEAAGFKVTENDDEHAIISGFILGDFQIYREGRKWVAECKGAGVRDVFTSRKELIESFINDIK